MLYAGQLSQMLAIGPTKISMLLLYRRIFRGSAFNIVTMILIALAVGWTVAFFFSNMLECVPIHEAWRNAPGLGGNPHCVDAVPMYLTQVYSDVVIDVLIFVVPIPLGEPLVPTYLIVVLTLVEHSLEAATSDQAKSRSHRYLPSGIYVCLVFCRRYRVSSSANSFEAPSHPAVQR